MSIIMLLWTGHDLLMSTIVARFFSLRKFMKINNDISLKKQKMSIHPWY